MLHTSAFETYIQKDVRTDERTNVRTENIQTDKFTHTTQTHAYIRTNRRTAKQADRRTETYTKMYENIRTDGLIDDRIES